MFNSNILDVMIGVVFIFLLLSMATSWFTEFWAQVLKLRSMHLKEYLRDWIDSGKAAGFVEDLYQGNVIGALYKKREKGWLADRDGPSFISAADFVTALFELSIKAELGQVQHSFADFKRYLRDNTEIPEKLKQPILTIMSEAAAKAGEQVDKMVLARMEIENWYDSVMDRAEGYYKRMIWWYGLFCAIFLAVICNIDTIAISRALWENQELRVTVASAATEFVQTTESLGFELEEGDGDSPGELAYRALQEVGLTLTEMESTNLPIFWKADKGQEDPYQQQFSNAFATFESSLSKVGGILLTATAASFGAQIWFDLLKQLVNMRSTGPKPEKTEEESGMGGGDLGIAYPFYERMEMLDYTAAAAPEPPEPPDQPILDEDDNP
ncbi:MAG: hypothetical protein JW757_00485 [Anaerolineales bacterium]|nr:hypothetical protein [Anaerolineales bacterium]